MEDTLLRGQMHALTALQTELSTQWIRPHLSKLEALLRELRRECDVHFEAQRHSQSVSTSERRIDHYPKGYCFEIAVFVFNRLLEKQHEIAYLREFQAAGGKITRVWGNLRNEFFQNALQIGDMYFDVANDSVDQRKDKLDIKRFTEANFSNLQSYEEYCRLAEKYWLTTMYPNYYFPDLMSYFPLLSIDARGIVKLESTAPYLLGLNLQSGLQLASDLLFRDRIGQLVDPATLAGINRFRLANELPATSIEAAGRLSDHKQRLAAHQDQLRARPPGFVGHLLGIGAAVQFSLN